MRRPLATMHILCLMLLNVAVASGDVVHSCADPDAPSALEAARKLKAPAAADAVDAEFEHASFWEDNGPLLQNAWDEWELEHLHTSSTASSSDGPFLEPELSAALDEAFDHPSKETEAAVRSFWASSLEHNLPKGVHSVQLLSPSGIRSLRELLDQATASGIPIRRPNGMNRRGVIIDPAVYGAVNVQSLVALVEGELIQRVVRPVGRMLFPDRVGCGDDVEYFAFTIRYDGSEDDIGGGPDSAERDVELKEHRDASVVTLNVNLNLEEEDYDGSEVFFRNYPSGDTNEDGSNDEIAGTVTFSPGTAVIHLGAHRHGALPISASANEMKKHGKRYNLVIWLFGTDGDVRIASYDTNENEQMSVEERWKGCNNTQAFSFE